MKCSRCQQQLDPDVNRTCIPNTMNILDANLTGIAVSINLSFLAVFFCDLDTSAPLNRRSSVGTCWGRRVTVER